MNYFEEREERETGNFLRGTPGKSLDRRRRQTGFQKNPPKSQESDYHGRGK